MEGYEGRNLPVVVCNGASVLHSSPFSPWLPGVPRWVPDLLTPDDVLEIETAAVVHNPLGDRSARLGANLKGRLF